MLPLAVATGNCEIRPYSYVREIRVDKKGRVTGVDVLRADKREHFQKAKAVVLSANGSESARLLLLSKSSKFPEGLANSSGSVGKYLMTGGGAGANGALRAPLNDYKGVIPGAGIVDYVPSDPKRGFYGGGRLTARGFDTPISYGLRGLSPGMRALGRRLQEGASRGSEPQDDHLLLRHAAAGRDQSRRSRSRRERRVGLARDADHVARAIRTTSRTWSSSAEVGRDSRGGRREEGLGLAGATTAAAARTTAAPAGWATTRRRRSSTSSTARTTCRTCSSSTAATSSQAAAITPR